MNLCICSCRRKERKEKVKGKPKKNSATIHETVALWEKLRQKATNTQEKQELAAAITSKVLGKISELANHHSASRVMQFCLRDASADHKVVSSCLVDI